VLLRLVSNFVFIVVLVCQLLSNYCGSGYPVNGYLVLLRLVSYWVLSVDLVSLLLGI
jgi:hypothetical protein